MPRCHGGSEANVHISQVSYIVEGDNPAIGELGAGGPATDVDKKVAELIVDQSPARYRRNAKRSRLTHR